MKINKLKSWKAATIALLCALLITVGMLSGLVWAQESPLKIVPAEITVVEGLKSVQTYVEPECVNPMNNIIWSAIPRGTSIDFDVYVRNEGLEPVDVAIQSTGDTSWGTVTITPPATTLIATGEVAHFVCDISVLASAPLGTYDFNLEVSEQ